MEKSEYNNADLNELFNFTYNFDLLKGIIETLLKNQRDLQKQVDSMKGEHQELQIIKFDLKEAKEEIKKLNELIQPIEGNPLNEDLSDISEFNIKGEKQKNTDDNENEKDEGKDKNKDKIKDKENFGFGKIKTFDQLKKKILEFRKEFEKTKNDLNENRQNINIINKNYEKIFGENDDNSSIDSRLSTIEKKLKRLLGDLYGEDVYLEDYLEKKRAEEKKNLLNLKEINRKLIQLEINKLDCGAFDLKTDRIYNQIEEVKNKVHELILNLYGYTGDQYDIDKNIKFLNENDFEKFKKNIGLEIERIWTEINLLKEKSEIIIENTKDRCSFKDLETNNHYIQEKMEESLAALNKKFVLKTDNNIAMKNLEDQFRRIILLLAAKIDHENDNWLIAKKPINGYSCAACESFIGDLKEEKNEKYLNWKKMPIREREKEKDNKENEKDKIYRLGNGYSHVLKMVGVDNNGNVLLNPNSNRDIKILFPGTTENNKIKEGSMNVHISNPKFPERIQSAHSKDSKEKTFHIIKSKNHEKKLPKIKGTMSTEDFDRIIDNPNPTLNIKSDNENNMSPKITKVMRKSHSKLNI